MTFTLVAAPTMALASPDEADPPKEYSFQFNGPGLDGAVQSGAIEDTAKFSNDPVFQQQLEEEGLQSAPLIECTFVSQIDEYRYSCVLSLPGARGTFLRVIDTRDGEVYAAAPQQIVVTWNDVATLPIQSGILDLQIAPDTPHFIYVDVPTLSTAAEHMLTMTLLDTPIEIQLTPIQWEWDFGQEGVPSITTRSPGGHYPDLSVAPIYQDVAEDVVITTTITWEGEYRVGDSTEWLPVFGQGTTTVSSEPFDLREYRTYLLHDPNQPDPTPDPGR